jgi:Zn-dependent M28 family amino/carboxypeptidase
MGTMLREMAAEAGIVIKGDQNPNAGSFYRSDQVNFAKAGIPALYLLPGEEYVPELELNTKAYRQLHYHQLIDEVNENWNLAGAERDMRLVFKLMMRVADAEAMPTWNEGNEFEQAWKELHNR